MPSLKVLGCGDAFNSGGQRHTSFLIETAAHKILIDCGANTVLGFKQEKLSFTELDAIIITHFHGDHYGGLPYLILEAAKVQKRKKPLMLISPPGLEERLQDLMNLLYPGSFDALESFPIHYTSYRNEDRLELPIGNFVAYKVSHTPKTLPHGVRLESDGKVIAYSGDTSWHENLVKLSDDSDLFICECNFYKIETPSHLNYTTLQEKKRTLKTKRLVLTHLGEEMLEVKGKIEIETLREGQNIEFLNSN